MIGEIRISISKLKGDSTRKKALIITLFITICLIIVTVGLVFPHLVQRDNNRKTQGHVEYDVKITPSGSSDYEIYLPILQEANGNVSEVMKSLSLTGTGNIHLINATYGQALWVQGHGKITIKGHINGKFPVAYFNLISQEIGGDHVKFWVYSNISYGESLSIIARGEVLNSHITYLSYFNKDINISGWQEIDGVKAVGQP